MANIKILVGSVYGNAMDVAEMCRENLLAAGHEVILLRQATIDEVVTDETEILLVCTSTTGQGEIPDSLMLLYCQLQDKQPDLKHVKYGLISLGDSSYDTYAEAGWLMDELFQKMEMQRIGEPLLIDACETLTPTEPADNWLVGWADSIASK